MDIFSQYKQQNPEAFQEKKQSQMSDEYGREYTGMAAWVIRLSGGRIRDARSASYALLVFVAFVLVVSIFLYVGEGSKKFSPDWTPYVAR